MVSMAINSEYLPRRKRVVDTTPSNSELLAVLQRIESKMDQMLCSFELMSAVNRVERNVDQIQQNMHLLSSSTKAVRTHEWRNHGNDTDGDVLRSEGQPTTSK